MFLSLFFTCEFSTNPMWNECENAIFSDFLFFQILFLSTALTSTDQYYSCPRVQILGNARMLLTFYLYVLNS